MQNNQMNRQADALVQRSETRMGAMALVSNTQLKLWKAMFAGFFVAGFMGALLFVTSINLGIGVSAKSVQRIQITALEPDRGTVGIAVRIVGTGFALERNIVYFGDGVITNVPASVPTKDRKKTQTLTFTVPVFLQSHECDKYMVSVPCPLKSLVSPGIYPVSVSNSSGVRSNILKFTVIESERPALPVIHSVNPVSGPVGASVTMIGSGFVQGGNYVRFAPSDGRPAGYVSSLSADGKTMTFIVPKELVSGICLTEICPMMLPVPLPVVPGLHLLSVVNSNGESNAVAFEVTAGNQLNVQIDRIEPISGPVGTKVRLSGRGFTPTGNTVHFGVGAVLDLPAKLDSSSGTIDFVVPKTVQPPECDLYMTPGKRPMPCPLAPVVISLDGKYPVSVSNANGKSNEVVFTVVGY